MNAHRAAVALTGLTALIGTALISGPASASTGGPGSMSAYHDQLVKLAASAPASRAGAPASKELVSNPAYSVLDVINDPIDSASSPELVEAGIGVPKTMQRRLLPGNTGDGHGAGAELRHADREDR